MDRFLKGYFIWVLAVVLLGAVVLGWNLTRRMPQHGPEKTAAGPAPQAEVSPASATPHTPAASAMAAAAAGGKPLGHPASSRAQTLDRVLSKCTVVDSVQSPPDAEGHYTKAVLYKRPDSPRYGYIRVEENFEPDPANPGGPAVSHGRTAMVGDHVIVRVDPALTPTQVEALFQSKGLSTRRKLYTPNLYLASVAQPNANSVPQALQALDSGASSVREAEPDYVHTTDAIPNDPDFGELWGLNNTGQYGGTAGVDIKAVRAWDVQTGSRNVIVGVIDSGVDIQHPDLAANIYKNPGEVLNGIDDDGNGLIDDINGWDFYQDDRTTQDNDGHGTHVAGTIGAVGDNGIGITGVCQKVSIMPLRAGDIDVIFLSASIDALYYAVEMGVSVTNHSYGGEGRSSFEETSFTFAGAQGMIMVCAAGNDTVDNDITPHYPSSFTVPNIISVASTDFNDKLSSFSNYGHTSVDLAAPGSYIYSTQPNDNYAFYSGTSMAAPHVAGAAALLLSDGIAASQIKQTLMNFTDPVSALSGNTVSGGRLNIANILQPNAPTILITPTVVEDGGNGNGDGIINPGESILIDLELRNTSAGPLYDPVVKLAYVAGNSLVTIDEDEATPGTIYGGSTITIPAAFTLTAGSSITTPDSTTFKITVSSDADPSLVFVAQVTIDVLRSSRVEGRVTGYPGNLPLAGATIAYNNNDMPHAGSVQTDSDGLYHFTIVNGQYDLLVSAPGYVTQSASATADDDSRIITHNFFLREPDLAVTPTAITPVLGPGDRTTVTVQLHNRGSVSHTWSAMQVPGKELAWVSLPVESGTIGPDETIDVDIDFLPLAVVAADYHTDIVFSTENAANGEAQLSVDPTVAPGEGIYITPAAVDFGTVVVNTPVSFDLLIQSVGSVGSAYQDYSITAPFTVEGMPASAQSLPVGKKLPITVHATPTTEGVFTGTLTIDTTDTSEQAQGLFTIPITMTVVGAPTMDLSALTLNSTLTSGSTDTQTLTVSNNGTSPLPLQVSMGTQTLSAPAPRIVVWNALSDQNPDGNEAMNIVTMLTRELDDAVYSYCNSVDPDVVATALQNADVLVVAELETASQDSSERAADALKNVFANFVTTGGHIIFCLEHHDPARRYGFITRTGLIDVDWSTIASNTIILSVEDPNNELLDGVPTPIATRNATGDFTFTDPDADVLITNMNNGHAVVVTKSIGLGQVIVMGWDFSGFNTSMQKLMANAVRGAQHVPWLTVSPLTDTVNPGTSNDLSVVFSAVGLNAGTYNASVTLSTEVVGIDPVTIPVTMTVNGYYGISGYDQFIATYFAASPAMGGLLLDPDFDGLPNLLEFLFASDPLQSTNPNAPRQIGVTGDIVRWSYVRREDVDPADIYYETSSDLKTWHRAVADTDYTQVSETSNGNGTETVVLDFDSGGASLYFVRVGLTYLEP